VKKNKSVHLDIIWMTIGSWILDWIEILEDNHIRGHKTTMSSLLNQRNLSLLLLNMKLIMNESWIQEWIWTIKMKHLYPNYHRPIKYFWKKMKLKVLSLFRTTLKTITKRQLRNPIWWVFMAGRNLLTTIIKSCDRIIVFL